MECPICFNVIENSCVGSCMHHYCYACLVKWMAFDAKCPQCKKPILELKLDREFDNINNPDSILIFEDVTRQVIVNFEDDTPPGITIINNTSGPGIKIKNLNVKDTCYKSGLRNGDVILFMNSVPCNEHSHSIEIIKECHRKRKKLICDLLII